MKVDSKTICQIAIIVDELDPVVANYKKVFNLPEPKVFNLPASSAVPAFTDGKQGEYSDCRMAVFEFDNVVLEITQPGKGDSPWKRWLDAHGPGVQHIGFRIPEANKDEAFKVLESTGSTLYHAGFYPGGTYTFVDGFKAFGLDFNIKWEADNREKIAAMIAHPEEVLKTL
jgi:hypothetical protein